MEVGIFKGLLGRLGVGRLGRNALLSTIGLAIRAVVQAGYLLVLSHWMGASGYGLFAGSVAAATLISPLSGWGIAVVLTQRVARTPSESKGAWAEAILQVLTTGTALVCLLMLGVSLVLPGHIDYPSMGLLALSELVALPLAQVATGLCIALDRGAAGAVCMCLVPVSRLLCVVAGLLLGVEGTPTHVARLHFGGSVIGALVAYGVIVSISGLPSWRRRLPMRATLRDGSRYAVGNLVSTSYLEVDKVLLLQMLGATVAGTYTAAFRVMSVFVLPVSALIGAALPRLFAQHGSPAGSRTLIIVTLSGLGYAVMAALLAVLVSPWMPRVFGASFEESSHYLLLLAPWTVLYALHQAAATGLTAFDRQMSRVCIEALGFVLIIVLNLLLDSRMGAAGAAWSLLATEVFMAGCCWWFLRKANLSPPRPVQG
ncbi:lipopolysaccharide biosynthesis protein [Dyella terrae]|uniref:lipopolysaccharide biosynthesis protein n=1 Tax=Dyella terrae TaxID=522259 RepID=UPI001EFEA4E5|nr:oligosaccharide flippase family protein [Dyella terrae]ULU25063.1 lipopolysaccharide biosynthesis protein [Dyella terrae]